MKPDVIVKTSDETMLFQPQNRSASEWLHRRCGLFSENITGNTEIRVHPRKSRRIVMELEAAGFIVAGEEQELC